MNSKIEWVRKEKLDTPFIDENGILIEKICQVHELRDIIYEIYKDTSGIWKNTIEYKQHHWSRIFEYPWILANGNFKAGEWVLDAAGGEGPLQYAISRLGSQVINIELNRQEPKPRIISLQGDLQDLDLQDNIFDKIICVSVLEHVENPIKAAKELWRLLKPGGRLLATMDVANYARWNHTVDKIYAQKLIDIFGLQLPPEPLHIAKKSFPEVYVEDHEPTEVELKVLCFYVDKPLKV